MLRFWEVFAPSIHKITICLESFFICFYVHFIISTPREVKSLFEKKKWQKRGNLGKALKWFSLLSYSHKPPAGLSSRFANFPSPSPLLSPGERKIFVRRVFSSLHMSIFLLSGKSPFTQSAHKPLESRNELVCSQSWEWKCRLRKRRDCRRMRGDWWDFLSTSWDRV